MSAENGSDIKVFETVTGPPIRFRVGEDVFTAVPVCPGKLMADITMTAPKPVEEQLASLMDFLDVVLVPESAERYAARFRSAENPISLEDAVDHINWLVERYGERPTVPPPSSSSGSTAEPVVAAGPSSTDGPPPAGLTLPPSLRIGS